MDKTLIDRLAREAGIFNPRRLCFSDNSDGTISLRSSQEPTPAELAIERIAALVAEECAQVCDRAAEDPSLGDLTENEGEAEHAARVIRLMFCTGQSGT